MSCHNENYLKFSGSHKSHCLCGRGRQSKEDGAGATGTCQLGCEPVNHFCCTFHGGKQGGASIRGGRGVDSPGLARRWCR